MKVSIVIPSYKHPELANQILMDIYQNCPTVDEVLVVDDYSNDPSTVKAYEFWQKNESFPLKVLMLAENVGFLKASNIGMKAASGDIIALISSDVRIHKNLPEILKPFFEKEPKCLLGGRFYTDTTGWNDFDGKIFPYVEGWALMTLKGNWVDFGYFDEQFAPHDFEDVDLSTTAWSKGYNLAQFNPWLGTVLEHIGAQSIGYNDERLAITEAHRELFRKKWVEK